MRKMVAFCSASLVLAAAASAQTYTFLNITNNNVVDAAAGEAQLRMTVSDAGSSQVNFRFFWEGTIPMSITQIYFDDENGAPGILDTIADLNPDNVAGVDFGLGNGPPVLPGGNAVDFQTSSGLQVGANPPPSQSGVNAAFPTEYLDIVVNLLGTNTFADVINALNQGFVDSDNRGLRVGLHVQAFEGGGSEAFVNNIIPLPPAAWMGLTTLGGAAWIGAVRRRRNSA